MKVKDIFKVGGVTSIADGRSEYLTEDNCCIDNKTLNDDAVVLHLKRASDSQWGDSHLRVQEQFKNGTKELLNWAFNSKAMVGLTLGELRELETGLSIELSQGRLSIR